jgi:hypothetical protein
MKTARYDMLGVTEFEYKVHFSRNLIGQPIANRNSGGYMYAIPTGSIMKIRWGVVLRVGEYESDV